MASTRSANNDDRWPRHIWWASDVWIGTSRRSRPDPHSGRRRGHIGDRHLRCRPRRRRVPHRLHATHRTVRHSGSVCGLQRHRTHRSLLRRQGPPPTITTRRPDVEPRHPHRRRHPDQPLNTRTCLLRQETRRSQDEQGSPPSVETAHLKRRLPAADRRRPAPRQLNDEWVRKGQPGTSLNPAWPASHPEHRLFGKVTSRTRHQTYTPRAETASPRINAPQHKPLDTKRLRYGRLVRRNREMGQRRRSTRSAIPGSSTLRLVRVVRVIRH